MTDSYVRTAVICPVAEWEVVEMTIADEVLSALAIHESVIDSPYQVDLCHRHVEHHQAAMVNGPRRFDEFLGPRQRLVLFDECA